MSSLASQLKSIQAANTNDVNQLKHRPSYLFTPRQAATITKDEIYGLGQNGFQALLQLEPRLDRFEDIFFSDRARQTDRTLLSKEENEKLDLSVGACLRLLGPHVLIRPCGQLLEWLIRQFRINEFNVKNLVALVLPFHETPQFAQILQILNLEPNTTFSSFIAVKTAVQALPRHTLVANMTKTPDLLRFVVSLLPSNLPDKTVHRTLISFWMATLLSYLDLRTHINQDEMAIFLPALFSGIRVKSQPESQLACYVVIASLATKAALAADAIESIISLIALHRSKEAKNDEAAITTCITIVQSQDEPSTLSEKTTLRLLERPTFVQTILDLARTHEMRFFLQSLAKSLVSVPGNSQVEEALSLFSAPNAPSQVVESLAKALFDSLLLKRGEDSLALLSKISQFAPAVLESLMNGRSGEKEVQDLVADLTAFGTAHNANLGIKSGDESVRVVTLRKALDSGDEDQVKEACQILLRDDSPQVAALIDSYASSILTTLQEDDILASCSTLLAGEALTRNILSQHIAFLAGPFADRHASSTQRTIELIWPRLLLTKSGKKSAQTVWETLSSSTLVKKGLLKGCQTLDQSTPTAFNIALAKQIASNAEEQEVGMIIKGLESLLATGKLLAGLVMVDLLSLGKVEPKAMQSLAWEWSSIAASIPAGASLFDGQAVSEEIMYSMFSKSKSAKVWHSLQACIAVRYAAGLSAPTSAAWSWLQADKDLSNGTRAYQLSVKELYVAAHSTTNKELATLMMTNLYTKTLKEELLLFLVNIWLSNDATVASIALLDAQEIIAARPEQAFDLQMLLPLLLATLMHKQREIRDAALQLVNQIGKAKAVNSTLRTFPSLYGSNSTTEILYLSAKDLHEYVTALQSARQDILLDSLGLQRLHANMGGSKKSCAKLRRAVLAMALSHANCSSRLDLSLHVLAAFQQVIDKDRLTLITPLWSKLVTTPTSLDSLKSEEAEDYINLLLAPFTGIGQLPLDQAGQPLALLLQPLQRSESSHMALIRPHVLTFITNQLFTSLPSEHKIHLVVELLKCPSQDLAADDQLRACIGVLSADARALLAILGNLRLSLLAGQADDRKAKRSKAGSAGPNSIEIAMRQMTVVLEVVDFSAVQAAASLLSLCFDIASVLVDVHTTQHIDIEYIAQLLMSAMLHITTNVKTFTVTEQTNLKAIMDIIRISLNPQTAQKALLFIAQIAQHMPQQVLQHVVPVFTFMGTNIMHRDDAYSNRVVNGIMSNVLPVLLQASRESATSSSGVVASLTDFLIVFTDAASHVPRHRQTSIYAQLVTLLGPQDFLAAVIRMLLDQRGPKAQKNESLLDKDSFGLPMRLLDHFPVSVRLVALGHMAEDLAIACRNNTVTGWHREGSEESQRKSARQLTYSASFITVALSDKASQSKIDSARSSGNQGLDVSLQAVAKQGLAAVAEIDKTGNFGALQTTFENMVSSAVRLLSLEVFSDVIVWLVSSSDKPVLLRGLALLVSRLAKTNLDRRATLLVAINNALRCIAEQIKSWSKADAAFISNILDHLVAIGRRSLVSEQGTLSQAFNTLLAATGGVLQRGSPLRAKAMQALCDLTPSIGTRLIPSLESAIKIGRQAVKAADAKISSLGWTLLSRLVQEPPTFAAAYAAELLDLLFSNKDEQNQDAVQLFKDSFAKAIPAKTLYPAIGKIWSEEGRSSPAIASSVLDILQVAFSSASPTDVVSVHKSAFKLLLEAFDQARELATEESLLVIAKAQTAYLNLVFKLSEATFKPAFLRTVDWAFVEPEENQGALRVWRCKVFLGLTTKLVKELRDLILPYLSSVVDHIVTILEDLANGKITDENLWMAVMQALHRLLEQGSSDFWTINRLRKLTVPLADQLDQTTRFKSERFDTYYRPVVIEFGLKSSEHEALLQLFNQSLLQKTRTESTELKAQAVLSIDAVWSHVNEPLLPFVAETVPFIIECLEDADIEGVTRQLVRTMESCLGEESGGLESYLS